MTIFTLISLMLIIFVMMLFFVVWFWIALSNKTPYYPSNLTKLKKLAKEGELKIDNSTKFIDIGSGDGRIVNWFASQNPQKAHGIEINPFLSLFSRVSSFLRRNEVKIINKNFLNHNFEDYNLVFMFLFDEQTSKLSPKLKAELDDKAIVISNTFKVKDMEPFKIVDGFYFYKIS